MTPTTGHQAITHHSNRRGISSFVWCLCWCGCHLIVTKILRFGWMSWMNHKKEETCLFGFYPLGSTHCWVFKHRIVLDNGSFPPSISACKYIYFMLNRLNSVTFLPNMWKLHHPSEPMCLSVLSVEQHWCQTEGRVSLIIKQDVTCRPNGCLPEPHCATHWQLTDAHPQWQYNQPKMD